MKIALMTNNYKPFVAGVPISVERLARGLRAMGHQVTVFAPSYKDQEAPDSPEERGVFRYSSLLSDFMGGIVLPNPLDRRIEEEFVRGQYDIIHVHHPMLIGRTAVYLSRKYHVPLTFTYHTRYEQYLCYIKGIRMLEEGAARNRTGPERLQKRLLSAIRDKIVPAYLHSFLKHCSFVLAPTKGMQDYLTGQLRVQEERTDVLPTGIEAQHFQVTEEEIHRLRADFQAEGIPLLLSVSRMAHEKNVDFLLKSIAAFKEKYQKPFRLLMVGDGPDRGEYEALCEELSLTKEVIFTGRVQNERIAPYFAAADAFVFASRTETQGIVILEAFAGKTPVIALDATGVRDLVRDGENGFLCPEDMDIFSGKILEYLTTEGLSGRLSQQAFKTAEEYREEAVAGKALRLYNRVIVQYEKERAARRESFHPAGFQDEWLYKI